MAVGVTVTVTVTQCHLSFRRVRKNCEKRLLALSCMSVRMEQHGSHWAEFYKNWYLSISRNVSRDNSNFIKSGQEWCALYMKTNIHLLSYRVSHSLPYWLAGGLLLRVATIRRTTDTFLSFLTKRTYSCSNFVAISSLVIDKHQLIYFFTFKTVLV